MNLEELIQYLDKHLTRNIENTMLQHKINHQKRLKRQQKSDQDLIQRDIRLDFYSKLRLKTKYLSLQNRIKDYLFYTDYLKQANMAKGAKTWRYVRNQNPTKTKGYEESLTSVQYSGIYDLNDMKSFKQGFSKDVCYKDVRRYTNMGKEME